MFFDNWADLGRVLAVGSAAYVTLVVVLRVSGKRTLAKFNAFDMVVTVALGSTLATILLTADVSYAEGAAALALLAALQLVAAWTAVRWRPFRRAIKSEPTLLLRDGELIASALRAQRVTESEVRQAVRAAGLGGLELAGAVVLETDGSLSVISAAQLGSASAVEDVSRPVTR